MDRPIIYPQKKDVRTTLRNLYRSAFDEVSKIPDTTPLDQYRFVGNEYYKKKIDKFYSCANFCLECRLLTKGELTILTRRIELNSGIIEVSIKA